MSSYVSIPTREIRTPIVRAEPHDALRMSSVLDPLSIKFAIYARAVATETLDIGCGDGLATAAVIERGGRVVAVDPDGALIARVGARIPGERHARLTTQIGSLPTVDFEDGRFAAIHAAHVFQVLSGQEILRSLEKMRRWLRPGGKLFVSAIEPGGVRWQPVVDYFESREAGGIRWPGFIPDVRRFLVDGAPLIPAFIHLLNSQVLRRELTSAGFRVEEVTRYVLPWDTEQTCCAVVASRPD
jgi:SAM-dependent methyltransferase